MAAYPVRGLDINSSYTIYHLLNEQKEKGVAVIYVGEDLDVLLDLCDRILVLAAARSAALWTRAPPPRRTWAADDQPRLSRSGQGGGSMSQVSTKEPLFHIVKREGVTFVRASLIRLALPFCWRWWSARSSLWA